MKHSFTYFNELANEYKHLNTQAQDINQAQKSQSNELAWAAVSVYLNGSKEDKESLKASIAKDAPHHSLRGMVSKANTVAFYLLTHEAIELKESIVTLEAINQVPDDSIPSVTVNELYTVVNNATKGDTQALARGKAIEKQALVQAAQFFNRDISKKEFALMPSPKQKAFMEEATAIMDAQEQSKTIAKAQENKAEALARILQEIAAHNLAQEVMQALAQVNEAQAA